MDMPKNINPADFKMNESNIPKLTHHEDFVMRMFFMRHPKKTGWYMCLYLLQEEEESINFTRWPAYQHFDTATLMGEMQSMLADLKQEFISVHANPPALPPTLAQQAATSRAISEQLTLDAWNAVISTTTPLPAQKPRFNLKK